MYVSMRNFQSQDTDADTLARNSGLNSQRHFLGESAKSEISLVIQMEDIVVLHVLRNDQCVTFYQWIDIQEGIKVLIFSNFIGRNLALRYFGEDGRHNYNVISRILNFITPEGTLASTISPFE